MFYTFQRIDDVMTVPIRVAALMWLALAVAMAPLYAGQPDTPQQQEEFVPIDELPPQDQLPAAPLLVAAYICVVLALFAYLISVARRLTVVQREIERLDADLKRSGRT